VVAALTSYGKLLWLLPGGAVRDSDPADYGVEEQTPVASSPALVDLDRDGFLDAVFMIGSTLVAFTQNGAMVDGFPIRDPVLGEGYGGALPPRPLVAALTDSGSPSVLVATSSGSLAAFDVGRRGALVPGFPLPVSRSIYTTPRLAGSSLYAVGGGFQEPERLTGWRLDNLGDVVWGGLYGNVQNTSFVSLEPVAGGETSASLLDEAETYNWPNPIREGRTFLRFRTGEDAEVSIMIVDLAGALVDELDAGSVRGGVPTELEWRTDAPSGVYFARVTATTASGREESRLIRMAIIR
ncbi:MAG: hypothetical protein IH855_02720, partial [Bacteroidetes bacterium]|nr:hypothetical protein [Bacteroidota bacterium]